MKPILLMKPPKVHTILQDSTADPLFIKTEPICQEGNGSSAVDGTSQATAARRLFDLEHSYVLQSGTEWQHQEPEEPVDVTSPAAEDPLVIGTGPSCLVDSAADSSTAPSRVSKRRAPRITPAQVMTLKAYMAFHPKLAKGKLWGPQSKEEQVAQWTRLASTLNAMGPTKSVDRWRTAWRDVKCSARRKSFQSQSANGFVEWPMKEVLDTEGPTLGASGRTCGEEPPFVPSSAVPLLESAWTNVLEEFLEDQHPNLVSSEFLTSPRLITSAAETLPSTSFPRLATSTVGTLPSTSSSQVATAPIETLPSTSFPRLATSTVGTLPSTSSSRVARSPVETLPLMNSAGVAAAAVGTIPSTSFPRLATSTVETFPSTSSSRVARSAVETLPLMNSPGVTPAAVGTISSIVTDSSSTASRSHKAAKKIWTVQEMVQKSMAATAATQATLNSISTDVAWLRLAMGQVLEASKQQAAASERQAAALERLAASNESWATFLIEHSKKS